MIKSTFKVIGFTGLSLFTIYAMYIADDKSLTSYAFTGWFVVAYYWWQEDRERAHAREEKKFQLLAERVAYLEHQLRQLER
jgi:hypothetical protein